MAIRLSKHGGECRFVWYESLTIWTNYSIIYIFRRGYKVKPPPVSSFSQHYPGNDKRYNKYLNDVRISVRESLIRSIEQGRFVKARKFPKSESLHDCMKRTIPYFTEKIVPEAINNGKRVLISSSENAIRGLLMHLCEIPGEKCQPIVFLSRKH